MSNKSDNTYKYLIEYSKHHLYFSYCQWKWLMVIYDPQQYTRSHELERANFWYYLGQTPDLDFMDSDYYKIVK